MLENLINIKSLSKEEILKIVELATKFKNNELTVNMADKVIALMFFENSTRTKCSFDVAIQKLGAKVLNFDVGTSALSKGETLKDTIENLYSIGVNACVIRDKSEDLIERTLNELSCNMKFLDAGEGLTKHPTQALLDFMTMQEEVGNLENKKITIIGDVLHSRVANSNIELLKKFNADLHFCAPEYFQDKTKDGTWHTNLKDALKDSSVVMLLRIQKERIIGDIDFNNYITNYQLSSNIFNECCPNAILMHPGPVNREIEITSELLDSKKGETILRQVRNGVFIRMAVIYSLFNKM